MDTAELRRALSDPSRRAANGFTLLGELAALAADSDKRDSAHDLLIRTLEHAGDLGPDRIVLDGLLRQAGLFPYMDLSHVGAADALAVELHRPPGLESIVLHAAQASVYRWLRDGEDLVLMAPTSFGKSLLIDALIAADHLDRVLIIVPSIALIDETRARLQQRFGDQRRVITHASQPLDKRSLIVMTQERALELSREEVPHLDLLVVDEFYKLDPHMDPERAGLLNAAFDRLRRCAKQVVMLGPNVGGLPENLPADFRPRVLATDVRTVAVDIERIDVPADERPNELVRLLRENDGQTLIYCRAPAGCRRVARHLLAAGLKYPGTGLPDTAHWLREHLHPDWGLPDWLDAGIGVHHAQLPRWLGQHQVHAFNEGRLHVLICTSTLIEGVNTAAKNVIIYENRVGDVNLDRFTFNNISGRSGRMWRHFIGRVFHFHRRPRGPLPEVDIPILTQSDDAHAGLLLELPAAERNPSSQARIDAVLDQNLLSERTLRANAGIPLDRQLSLAARLDEDPGYFAGVLGWSGPPRKQELRAACELIVNHLVPIKGRHHGIATAAQLAGRLDRLRIDPRVDTLIADELERDFATDADEAVEQTMQFLRSWAQFEFPRQLRALERIADEVLRRAGHEVGDLGAFAAACERLFLPPNVQTLDEYGIPPQLAQRLFPKGDSSLDVLLGGVRDLDASRVEDPLERELLVFAQSRL